MVDQPYPQDVSFLILTATGLITILVLGLLTFAIYYQKKLLLQQHAKQLMEVQLQQQMLLGTINGQEKERARLSREIHDGLGAQLASIKLMLENARSLQDLSQKNDTEARSIQLLQESIQELRTTTQSLLPQPLMRFGLVKGLENYMKQINELAKVKTTFCSNTSELELTQFQSLSLYRIIQELVRNALEHGKADNFSLSVNSNYDLLHLVFEDNGISYDWKSLKDNHLSDPGSGITNIEARRQLLSAELSHEALHPGNRLHLELPLNLTDDDTNC